MRRYIIKNFKGFAQGLSDRVKKLADEQISAGRTAQYLFAKFGAQ